MDYFKNLQDPSALATRGLASASEGAARMSRATGVTRTNDSGPNYGEFAAGLGQAAVGIFQQLKANKLEAAAGEFQIQMEKDPNYKPDYSKMGADDAKAFNLARLRVLDQKRANAEWQREEMTTKKLKYDLQHAALTEHFNRGNALYASNQKQAFKEYEKAYESLVDGCDIEFGEDGMSYTITNPDGSKDEPVRFNSTAALKTHLDQMYEKVARPEDFVKTHMGVEAEREKANTRVWLNPIILEDGKGRKVYRYTGFQDKETGKALPDKYELDGEEVSESFIKKNGFFKPEVLASDLAMGKTGAEIKNLGLTGGKIAAETGVLGATQEKIKEETKNIPEEVKKTQAETNRIKAEAEKLTKEAAAVGSGGVDLKNASPEYKLAYGINQVLGVSMEDAMNYVLAKGAEDAKLKIISQMITAVGGDFEDPGVQSAIKELGLQSILAPQKALGVEKNGKEQPKGSGVEKKEPRKVTVEEVVSKLQEQFPDAPEGKVKYLGPNKFVKQNGTWVLQK